MNLLVVGAAGQLGSALLESCSPGCHVVGLTRSELDLRDLEAIPHVLREHSFDVLVNCAAYNDTRRAEEDPLPAFRINGEAVERMADAARIQGAAFVSVSTDYVFAGELGRPLKESDPPSPLNLYGASKLFGETLARRTYPQGTWIIRTASLFGLAGARRERGSFVESIIARSQREETIRVVSDVSMSPTSAEDLSEGILRLLSAGAEPGTYHMVNQGQASWYELAAAVVETLSLGIRLEPVAAAELDRQIRRPRFSVLDQRKAGDLCGPLPHWRESLSRYLEQRAVRN
jgi:dTDP-4-dehydrorhamnose reductase